MSTEDDTTPSSTENADFAALVEQAAEIEGAQQQAQEQRQEVQAASELQQMAKELADALRMVRMMAAPLMRWWPEFMEVWSDQVLQGLADNGAEIMRRNGWTMGEAWNALGPYIGLLGALLPPSLLTWQAIQARRERARHGSDQPAAH